MSRVICRTLVGTRAAFEENRCRLGNLAKIEDAEIYWGNGVIAVVASKEWSDYLGGRTETPPESQGNNTPFDFNEQELMQFLGLEVRI